MGGRRGSGTEDIQVRKTRDGEEEDSEDSVEVVKLL
jgi:hypothetical protein